MLRYLTGVLILLGLSALAQADSVGEVKDGRGDVEPVWTIDAKSLNESSGLEYWQGAWWSHNDSGGAPALYRANEPDFKQARILKVPGATNVDWEELTTLGDDLLVCDIGDNAQQRDDLKIYRVAWDAEKSEINTVATYPVTYPDGKHDAEGAFTINGQLHIVGKNRTEGFTGVYRFNELKDGQPNTPEKIGELEINKRVQITAADADDKRIVLLSYSHIFVYAPDKPTGAPLKSIRIHASQCEGVGIHDNGLVYGNEQRNVYRIDDFFEREFTSLLPPPVTTTLPFCDAEQTPDGSGEDWKDAGVTLDLKNLREGEYLRWMIAGPWLMLAGKFEYDSFASSGAKGDRLGSGLMFMISKHDNDFIADGDMLLWLGDNGATGVDVWTMNTTNLKIQAIKGHKVAGKVEDGIWYFEYALPLTKVFGEGKLPDSFQANVWGYNLHGEDEPHLSGQSIFCFQNPYTWAEGTITYPDKK